MVPAHVVAVVLQAAAAVKTSKYLNHKTSTKSDEPSSDFVLLVAPNGSYRISPYVQAASNLQLKILIISDSEHSLVSEVAQGIHVDFNKIQAALDTIFSAIAKKNILAVIPTDDKCVDIASQIAAKLNLPHNSPESAKLTYRKDLARLALQAQQCNTPEFKVINFKDIDDIAAALNYPVVLKPLMLSGSKGVIRADNADECKIAAKRIKAILLTQNNSAYEYQHILIESYLDGQEVAVEGFMINGEFQLLTLFDKPEALTGPYFEESYYLTPSKLGKAIQHDILFEINRCCLAYGLSHGPIHAEARLTKEGVFLLEIASRTIGGQCAQLIEFSLGVKLEELVISYMCSRTTAFQKQQKYAGVLMIPITKQGMLKRVEGLTQALQVKNIIDIEIHIQPGYELIPLPEGSSYLGFIFAQSDQFESTLNALRQAYEKLKFITQPVWKIG